jgi:hypothetical protein
VRPDTAPLVSKHEHMASEIDAIVARSLGAHADPMRLALQRVFAHYCDVLTERLNRTPDAHLAAFIDMLGGTPQPAVPAHTPMTFKAAQAASNAPVPIVPRHTEVAAPPKAGDAEPVVFQTLADLAVVRAGFACAIAVDYGRALVINAR